MGAQPKGHHPPQRAGAPSKGRRPSNPTFVIASNAMVSDTSVALARRKALGAFYTPAALAERMVRWAVRTDADCVLDPSAGELVFLEAAARRLEELGADAERRHTQLFGIEINPEAHEAARAELDLDEDRLLLADFFEVEPDQIPAADAVVGNPPYVRYQGFNAQRGLGHRRAAEAGVVLPRLASSWAPFLIYGVRFVVQGGRIAQVLPAELLHAQYAKDVFAYLQDAFTRVVVCSFEERIFPGALEEVIVLLADGKSEGRAPAVEHFNVDNLLGFAPERLLATAPARVPEPSTGRGRRDKLLFRLLGEHSQRIYAEAADDEGVASLGDFASVDIGVVTGANGFFLRTPDEAAALHEKLLRPTLSKAAHVPGARVRSEDLARLIERGARCFLLAVLSHPDADHADGLAALIHEGEGKKVHQAYKCRIRDPWWRVPLPREGPPDLVLTYCANRHPRIAVNDADVLTTNTLHNVRVRLGSPTPRALAVGFYNSLTLLSAELVGRSYGGGVLKLEPTEAESLLMPPIPEHLGERVDEIDALIRRGQSGVALDIIDRLTLKDQLGLGDDDLLALRAGWERLRGRRQARSKSPA